MFFLFVIWQKRKSARDQKDISSNDPISLDAKKAYEYLADAIRFIFWNYVPSYLS